MTEEIAEKVLLPLLVVAIPIVEILGKKFIAFLHSKTAKGKAQAAAKEEARKKELESAIEGVMHELSIHQADLDTRMENAYKTCKLGTRMDEEFIRINKDLKLLKEGVQGLLRTELRLQYSTYRRQGWASPEIKTDIEHLYQIYHSMGPNGVMDKAHKEFIDLPDEIPETLKRRASDRKKDKE